MADVIKSIGTTGYDYASIAAWEAASYGATASDDAFGEVYGTVIEAGAVVVNDTTPLSVTLRSATGERHDGTEGSGATCVADDQANPFTFDVAITIEWLEFDGDGGNCINLILVNGPAHFTIQNNLMHNIRPSRSSPSTSIFRAGSFAATTIDLFNNAIFDIINTSSGTAGGIQVANSSTSRVYNNTVYGCELVGIHINDDSDFTYRNNLSYNNGTDYSDDAPANATTSTNGSEDSSSPDGASYRTLTADFVNAAAGDFNLESTSDTNVLEGGTDLTTTGNVDLAGRDRDSEGDDWSLGALQYVAAVGGLSIPVAMHHFTKNIGVR